MYESNIGVSETSSTADKRSSTECVSEKNGESSKKMKTEDEDKKEYAVKEPTISKETDPNEELMEKLRKMNYNPWWELYNREAVKFTSMVAFKQHLRNKGVLRLNEWNSWLDFRKAVEEDLTKWTNKYLNPGLNIWQSLVFNEITRTDPKTGETVLRTDNKIKHINVLDTRGNVEKSFFCCYLKAMFPEEVVYVQNGSVDKITAAKYPNAKLILIDLNRGKCNNNIMEMMENRMERLKNGMYRAKHDKLSIEDMEMLSLFEPAHVQPDPELALMPIFIVFSNDDEFKDFLSDFIIYWIGGISGDKKDYIGLHWTQVKALSLQENISLSNFKRQISVEDREKDFYNHFPYKCPLVRLCLSSKLKVKRESTNQEFYSI